MLSSLKEDKFLEFKDSPALYGQDRTNWGYRTKSICLPRDSAYFCMKPIAILGWTI